MGLRTKTWTIACATLGLVSFSQFPEFAQQYRQHLAGGIGELKDVVTQFDVDAKSQNLSREEALETLSNSLEDLPRERGNSMRDVIDRYEGLVGQRNGMNEVVPVFHPFHILKNPDSKIFNGTWKIYKPAVPVTAEAAVWGGIGAFLATLLARIPVAGFRRRRKNKTEAALEASVRNL